MNIAANILRWIYRWLNRAEEVLVVISAVLMLTSIFAMVITRYVLHIPTPYLHELSIWTLYAIVFIGAAVGTRQLGHIKVDVIPLVVHSERGKGIIALSVNIALLIICCYFSYICYVYMIRMFSMSGYSASMPVVHLGWIKSLLFIGTLLWSVHLAVIVIKDSRALLKRFQ